MPRAPKLATTILDDQETATIPANLPEPRVASHPDSTRVLLPELPAPDEYAVRNRQNAWQHITAGKEGVSDLVLPPLREIPLPDHEFWFRHGAFRGRLEDRTDADGETLPAPIEVYRQTKTYRDTKGVPDSAQADVQYSAYVDTLVYGPWDDADELIALDPKRANGRRDLSFLVRIWARVLGHALAALSDIKRSGREVEDRRIDALTRRLAVIDDLRREAGMAKPN